jgi:hypothetical protein
MSLLCSVQEVPVSASLRISLDRIYCKNHNSASLREKPFERGLRLNVISAVQFSMYRAETRFAAVVLKRNG